MKSMSNQVTLQSHVAPTSHCMALMKMHLKYETFMALSAEKVPDL